MGCRDRPLERALPAAAVAVGLLLVAGPFMSTAVRSVTAADAGWTFSLDNFAVKPLLFELYLSCSRMCAPI